MVTYSSHNAVAPAGTTEVGLPWTLKEWRQQQYKIAEKEQVV